MNVKNSVSRWTQNCRWVKLRPEVKKTWIFILVKAKLKFILTWESRKFAFTFFQDQFLLSLVGDLWDFRASLRMNVKKSVSRWTQNCRWVKLRPEVNKTWIT